VLNCNLLEENVENTFTEYQQSISFSSLPFPPFPSTYSPGIQIMSKIALGEWFVWNKFMILSSYDIASVQLAFTNNNIILL
jgi:hypothetical protein